MHSIHFDDLLRALPAVASRRGVLHSLALLALTAVGLPGPVDARKKHKRKKRKIKRNSFGCVNVGGFCKNSEQCCSGICTGKKGKKKCQGHDAGACQADQDTCVDGNPTCAAAGLCYQTTGQASFCGQTANCLDCQTDTECRATFGPGAACVACALCQNVGKTGCSAPAA